MSRLFFVATTVILFLSFTSRRELHYNDLSQLMLSGDVSNIESMGFHYWKTEDGFRGYASSDYRVQLWYKPNEEIHLSWEGELAINGSIPSRIQTERFDDGPVHVLFVYPLKGTSMHSN